MDFIKIPLCSCEIGRCRKEHGVIKCFLNESVQTDIRFKVGKSNASTSIEVGIKKNSKKYSTSTSIEADESNNWQLARSIDTSTHRLHSQRVPLSEEVRSVNHNANDDTFRNVETSATTSVSNFLPQQSSAVQSLTKIDIAHSQERNRDAFSKDEDQRKPSSGTKLIDREDQDRIDYTNEQEIPETTVSQEEFQNTNDYLTHSQIATTKWAASAIPRKNKAKGSTQSFGKGFSTTLKPAKLGKSRSKISHGRKKSSLLNGSVSPLKKLPKKQNGSICSHRAASWQNGQCSNSSVRWSPNMWNCVCSSSVPLKASSVSHFAQCDSGNQIFDPCRRNDCREDTRQYRCEFRNKTDNMNYYKLCQHQRSCIQPSYCGEPLVKSGLEACNLHRIHINSTPCIRTQFQDSPIKRAEVKTCFRSTPRYRNVIDNCYTNMPLKTCYACKNLRTICIPDRVCCPQRCGVIQPMAQVYCYSL